MKSFVRAGFAFARVVSTGRFFLGLALGLLAAAALWGGMFLWSLGLSLTVTDRNIASWYRVKSAIIDRIDGPKRIVLVGGSNVIYGISARQIEAEAGIPTVNFGTHAALSLDYLLGKIIRKVRTGDIVVLSLEWNHFNRSPTELNEVSGPYLLAADEDYLRRLPPADLARLVMTSGWDRIFLPLKISWRENERIQGLVNESAANRILNQRGDIIHNSPAEKGPAQQRDLDRVVILPEAVLNARVDPDDPVWKRIENFVKSCRRKKAAVFVTFPSMMDDPGYRTPGAAKVYRRFEENFRSMGAKVLTRQEDTLYPREYFFDTFYHLQSDARKLRTDLILDALTRAGVLPAKPVP